MNSAVVAVPWRRDVGVIGLVSTCHASSHFSHLLLPLMFPFFVRDLGLTYAGLGGVMSLFFAVSFCAQTVSGFAVDRYGARRILFAAQILMALACLWLSQVQNLTGLMLGSAVLGIGNGVYHPVDYSVLNRQVQPIRLGHAYSVHNISGTLGWALAPPFMVGLSSLWGWQMAYVGAAMVYLLLLAVCAWRSPWLETRQPQNPQAASTSSVNQLNLWGLLRLPAVVWSFVFLFCMTMTYSVVQNFLVTILQKVHGLGLVSANLTLTAYLLTAAVGNLLGGFVMSRWGAHADRIVAWCMGLAGSWMLISATGWLGPWGTPVSLTLTALAVGMGAPARDLLIKQATPVGATGRVYGLVFAGLDVGSATSPLIFGPLMDHGFYGLTLAGAAFSLLCGGLVSMALAKNLSARTPPFQASGVKS